jgi:hypothetical protein
MPLPGPGTLQPPYYVVALSIVGKMESMLFLEVAGSGAHHPDFPGPVCVNPCGISSVTQNWYSDDASEIPDPRMAEGRRNITRSRFVALRTMQISDFSFSLSWHSS